MSYALLFYYDLEVIQVNIVFVLALNIHECKNDNL